MIPQPTYIDMLISAAIVAFPIALYIHKKKQRAKKAQEAAKTN